MTGVDAPVGNAAPGIEVIGAGLGRTGTASLRAALQQLGFDPCYHMHENFDRPERFALWEEAVRCKDAGQPLDWRPLLAGYRAIVDWPGAYFWRELTSIHPHAKVILTVRGPDRWYDSISATIFPFLEQLEDSGGPALPGDVVMARTFPGITADRAQCTGMFAAHHAAVREMIAPERLLVFEVKEGWKPLCTFLGVPVPDGEPFPHRNDTAAFNTANP